MCIDKSSQHNAAHYFAIDIISTESEWQKYQIIQKCYIVRAVVAYAHFLVQTSMLPYK